MKRAIGRLPTAALLTAGLLPMGAAGAASADDTGNSAPAVCLGRQGRQGDTVTPSRDPHESAPACRFVNRSYSPGT